MAVSCVGHLRRWSGRWFELVWCGVPSGALQDLLPGFSQHIDSQRETSCRAQGWSALLRQRIATP